MTLLGRVLAFVNLFFSLVVVFFIVQSYAKRTDWHRAFEESKKALNQAENQRDQYMKSEQEALAKAATVQGTLDQTIKNCDTERANFKAQLADRDNQIAKQKDLMAKKGLGEQNQLSEVDRLGKHAESLKQALAAANKRLDDQAKDKEDLRQRAVKAEIDNKSLIGRNNELLSVIEEKEKELVRLRATASGVVTTASNAPNPPPGDVVGRVKNYDATSGLLTINVGSDAGVLKGHTLFVYRLEPNGQYVGQVRIMDVRPNEAVGKMINKPRVPVQVNDKVARKIS
jgi:hypothetical protein